jgi:hypothetical protein
MIARSQTPLRRQRKSTHSGPLDSEDPGVAAATITVDTPAALQAVVHSTHEYRMSCTGYTFKIME